MADKIMKTLTLGDNTYEIYDETARSSIETLKAETIIYDAGEGLSLTTTSSTNITFSLDTSGVDSGSYGLSENASPAHGETFSVPYLTVDSYGRITSASTKTITLPLDNDTTYSAGDGLLLSNDRTFSVSYGDSATDLGISSAGSAITVSRSDHVHALPELNSCTGILTIDKGGTGATDAATALTNLGAAASSHTHNYAGSSSEGGIANSALQIENTYWSTESERTSSYSCASFTVNSLGSATGIVGEPEIVMSGGNVYQLPCPFDKEEFNTYQIYSTYNLVASSTEPTNPVKGMIWLQIPDTTSTT